MAQTTNTKIVTVFGATGTQGSSVVKSLLQNKSFKVRAVTRMVTSKSAQELRALGAEIVQADGWKKEEVVKAFSGSWVAFVNTNSNDPCFFGENGLDESVLGKTVIDGIIEAGTVKHLVFSSIPHTSVLADGKMAIKATESQFETVCPVYAGWYMENFGNPQFSQVLGGFPFTPNEKGILTICCPQWGISTDRPVPWIAVQEDFGDIVHGVLLSPHEYHDKPVPAFSNPLSFPEVIAAFESVTGKKAQYVRQASWDMFGAGIDLIENERRLFGSGQITDGKYFENAYTPTDIPAELKAKAVQAKGNGSDDAALFTFKRWFEKNL